VRAAGSSGTIMTLSTLATSSIEEVIAASTGPVWFQLYVYKDRDVTESLVKRAEQAGCKAIVLTIDTPMLGRRERDVRNNFQLPDNLTLKNLISAGFEELPSDVQGSGLAAYMADLYNTSLTWKDVAWLKTVTTLPVLVKGVMRADDAVRAIDHGVDGIIVSNHGGRQLDTVPATITVLPEIIEAVKGRVEVFVDGGIRRGTDVLKALAYGARAVFIGRPILWGLAIGGESGVRNTLELLRHELDLAMVLSGCQSVQSVPRDLIYERR
jgi:4-hydroxymandelate oxidase